MIITPVDHGLTLGVSKGGRTTDTLHVSALYNDLFQDLEPKRYTRGGTPDPLRLEAGLAFEEMLENALKERIASTHRPGEIISDEGIIASPDLIIYNSHIRVGEIKLTWMSCRGLPDTVSNGFPPKFDKYFVQMKAYCHILDTPYARLLGFFVNGDYAKDGPMSPMFKAWDVEFTARELKENWQMLINHGKQKGLL